MILVITFDSSEECSPFRDLLKVAILKCAPETTLLQSLNIYSNSNPKTCVNNQIDGGFHLQSARAAKGEHKICKLGARQI